MNVLFLDLRERARVSLTRIIMFMHYDHKIVPKTSPFTNSMHAIKVDHSMNILLPIVASIMNAGRFIGYMSRVQNSPYIVSLGL